MANRAGINLLPEEGREEERQRERKRLITFGSLGILLVIVLLTAGSYLYAGYLRSSAESAKASIDASSKKLNDLSSVETLVRTVNNKLVRLQAVLANYPRFSILLDDVAGFTPNGVSLTSLAFDSSGRLSLSGIASGPTTFGDFVNILRDPKLGGTKFSNVEIVSVSGGGKQGDYRFALQMSRKASL